MSRLSSGRRCRLAVLLCLVTAVSSDLDAALQTWRLQARFWRTSEVSWTVEEAAVYGRRQVNGGCHCRMLCLTDTNCVAAQLVSTPGPTCHLASRRGNASSSGAITFVRQGFARLGEHCLAGDYNECHEGMCLTGVCEIPTDCSDLLRLDVAPSEVGSGLYSIQAFPDQPEIQLFCDMEAQGGGWTIFQRRQDAPDDEQLDFYRDWASYRDGFGNRTGQFWLGNELIHQLTARGPHELLIQLEDFEGEVRYAKYASFSISSETDKFRLHLGAYSGDAGDSFSGQVEYQFSTRDQDNDVHAASCSEMFKGGWWYTSCHAANLNGRYLRGITDQYALGVVWRAWKEYYYSLKFTSMGLRPYLV